MTTVTVVIPAYNAEKYIADTIESVLDQTFADFELVVVDDGSKDQTADIVQAYRDRDDRVDLISQANQGVSTARNHGIQQTRGELVAFLDADDLWEPRKLQAHIEHFQANPNLGMSYGKIAYMSCDGVKTGGLSNLRLRDVEPYHLYYENLTCTPSNVVVRRSAVEQVGGFDRYLCGFEDMEFSLRIIFGGWQVEGLNEELVCYRASPGGVSSQLSKMEYEWHLFNNKVMTYAPRLVQQHGRRAQAIALAPEVGIDFMNRALGADWQMLLREPKRTLFTLFAVYSRRFFSKA
jgi:glycosyltransferase involved in cell wall biosynthesis